MASTPVRVMPLPAGGPHFSEGASQGSARSSFGAPPATVEPGAVTLSALALSQLAPADIGSCQHCGGPIPVVAGRESSALGRAAGSVPPKVIIPAQNGRSTAGNGAGPRSAALAEVRFLTVAEVASLTRVSKMTVYRLVHSGEMSSVRVGRFFRVPEEAAHAYLRGAFPDAEYD